MGQHTFIGSVSPPATTPTKLGDMYIDPIHDRAFVAVGTTDANDWLEQGGLKDWNEYFAQFNIIDASNADYTVPTDADYVHLYQEDAAMSARAKVVNLPDLAIRGGKLLLFVRIYGDDTQVASSDTVTFQCYGTDVLSPENEGEDVSSLTYTIERDTIIVGSADPVDRRWCFAVLMTGG